MTSPKRFTAPRRPPTGEQIRAARTRAGLSQAELVAQLGETVTRERLSAWERGKAGTKDPELIRLLWQLVEENS